MKDPADSFAAKAGDLLPLCDFLGLLLAGYFSLFAHATVAASAAALPGAWGDLHRLTWVAAAIAPFILYEQRFAALASAGDSAALSRDFVRRLLTFFVVAGVIAFAGRWLEDAPRGWLATWLGSSMLATAASRALLARILRRLALRAAPVDRGIALKVLPVAINYSSFRKFGKNVRLNFGTFVTREDIQPENGYGRSIQQFNGFLQQQLEPFVFEIDNDDTKQLYHTFYVPQHPVKKILLFLPSIAGWVLHAPLYFPVKHVVLKKINSTDHYDSLMVAILFLTYPIYVVMITLLAFTNTRQWNCFLLLAVFPFTAWAQLQLKKQLD